MQNGGRLAGTLAVLLLAAGCAQQAPAAVDPDGIGIEYLAHASFLLHGADGTTLLIDPFQSRVWLGYDFPDVPNPDAVLVTHPHYDHDGGMFRGAAWPWPEAQRLSEPGTTTVGAFTVRGVRGKHADPYGKEFGQKNTIFVVDAAGLRIVHLGDNGPLTPENVSEIGPVDVLMVPGDGLYHILDPQATDAAIEALAPRVVIPMHYRIPSLEASEDSPEDLGDLDPWLEKREPVLRIQGNVTHLTSGNLPDQRVFMILDHSPTIPPVQAPGQASSSP